MSEKIWIRCRNCGYRTRYVFYSPDSIYCQGCDQKVGETDRHVFSDLAALSGEEIIHPDSGQTLATVHWYDESVRVDRS